MTEINNIEDWSKLLTIAQNGDKIIQYEVGCCYDNGLIINDEILVKEDKTEAFSWFLLSHKSGNIDATIRTADFLSEGEYCEKDIELAIKLYEEGIEKGIGYASSNLATIYRDKKDFKKAFELYQTAQKIDDSNLIEVAFCYYFGIGTEQNKLIAFDIFLKIANDTSVSRNSDFEIEEANYYLGLYYLEGDIIKKSIEKARYYFEKANIDNDHRSANEILLIIGRN